MKKNTLNRLVKEIHNMGEFLEAGYNLKNATIQNIDFTNQEINWKSLDLENATFLGCKLNKNDYKEIIDQGGVLFPHKTDLPYKPYRSQLYTWQELYKETKEGHSIDLEIYNHFSASKYAPSMMEALLQRIHDHSIDDALRDFLNANEEGKYGHKSIGIMGGHGTKRSNFYYGEVARSAYLLTKADYLVISGGGPGIMEAANLGAYMANYSADELEDALDIISEVEYFANEGFHETAMSVLSKYPNGKISAAIPTWFYGHEPSNVFARHIAKYFSNSIREDTLLAICLYGILYAPGSAGTTQEIFMDAAQNHYVTFDHISPMVFLGKDRYEKETNLYSTLYELASGKEYQKLMRLVNSAEEVAHAFDELQPIHKDDLS